MDHLKAESNMSSVTLMPPKLWCGLVAALATPSPVCALVHPSERLFSLLERMKSEDITVDPVAMQTLQQEMPVLFKLMRLLKYMPTKVLSPLIAALIEKSAAPFSSGSDHLVVSVNASKMKPLSFFHSCLPSDLEERMLQIVPRPPQKFAQNEVLDIQRCCQESSLCSVSMVRNHCYLV